jgi:hypothetical protein
MYDEVCTGIATTMHPCHPCCYSNINHDFSARSMDRLLSLVKPGLRVLRLVDGPGPGRQEGYEILSTLKNMQELHIEVGQQQLQPEPTSPWVLHGPEQQADSF